MCRGAGDSGDEVPTHCDSRAVYVNLVYTVATFAFMSASLPLGFVADKLGPRRTAAACNIAAGVGALMVATPTRWGMPIDTFFAGLPVAAFFGPGLQVAFATVANLFPGSEGTVIGVMSGMMGGSAIMFPVYNAVHAAAPSVSLSALFTAHAAMCGLFACLSRLFPLRAVSEAAAAQEAEVEIIKPTDGPRDNETCGGEVPDRSGNGGIATLPTASDRGTAAQRGAPVAGADPEGAVEGLVSVKEVSRQAPLSLLALACSRPVLALLLLYTVHYLRLAFYLGTASLQLLRLAGGDEGVASTYLTLLGWIAPFGCLAAPVIGRIDDARGHRFAMALVHVMGLVHCVVTLVPFLPVQAVGMMLYTAQQEMLFAVGLARVLKLVPTHQFGVASGAFLLLGALVRSASAHSPHAACHSPPP